MHNKVHELTRTTKSKRWLLPFEAQHNVSSVAEDAAGRVNEKTRASIERKYRSGPQEFGFEVPIWLHNVLLVQSGDC